METKIYGYSDDLIIMEGQIEGERDCYHESKVGVSFRCSDGTKGIIKRECDWKITLSEKGKLFKSNEFIVDEEENIHSDMLILGEGIEWIKIEETFTGDSSKGII